MARFSMPTRSRISRRNRPTANRRRSTDYELYEEDDEYVLSLELPGFETEDITLTWNDGVLNVAAEREDARRGTRTYHKRFKLPKEVDDEEMRAEYENGILEVRLPVQQPSTVQGKRIELSG